MQALSFYADTADENEMSSHQSFQSDYSPDEAELAVNDLLALEIESSDSATQQSVTRRTTDLVRMYLQEIGRVDLLERDEEISEAQKFSATYGCDRSVPRQL